MKFKLIESIRSQLQKNTAGESQNKVSVGLDIGRAYLTAIQVSQAGDRYTLERWAHQPTEQNTPLSSQIKKLFSEAQITEKKVRVSVKGQGVILRFIPFPRMARDEFQSSIQYEAEKYLPFAISEVVLDFHILETPKAKGGESSKMMDVLLVAARKQEIMRLIKILQEADLRLELVDVDAIAFSNAFVFSVKEAADKVSVLIDFGARDANINIMDRGQLRFSRDLTFGGYDITQHLKRKLQIDDAAAVAIQTEPEKAKADQLQCLEQSLESLIHEIKTSLSFYYGQHADAEHAASIYVSGGLAKMDLLRKTIQHEMNMPVLLWNPLAPLALAETIKKESANEQAAYLPVSMGLALR